MVVRAPRRRLPILSGFPDSKVVRLRYRNFILLPADPAEAPVTSIAYHTFFANGMYKPNFDTAADTRQPRGFDQWMAAYDHYTVIGSKMTVQWLPNATSDVSPGIFGIVLDDNTSLGYTSVQDCLESSQSTKPTFFGPLTTLTAGRNPIISKSFSAKRFFHKTSIVGDGTYRGSEAGNPTGS